PFGAEKCTAPNIRSAYPRTPANPSANASLAAAIAKHLKIRDGIIYGAIAQTSLPCRFEIIQQNPLVVLDGAHNPMKIANVVHNAKQLTYATLYTMFGCATTKDAAAMVRQLERVTDSFIFTTPRGTAHTFYEPKKLAAMTALPKRVAPNPRTALKAALQKIKPDDCLLITGSFYLAGDLRKHWIPEKTILTKRNHA
ncbi:MAG: cyanophycin synthetase, partial [Patescibacteria group bacterium]